MLGPLLPQPCPPIQRPSVRVSFMVELFVLWVEHAPGGRGLGHWVKMKSEGKNAGMVGKVRLQRARPPRQQEGPSPGTFAPRLPELQVPATTSGDMVCLAGFLLGAKCWDLLRHVHRVSSLLITSCLSLAPAFPPKFQSVHIPEDPMRIFIRIEYGRTDISTRSRVPVHYHSAPVHLAFFNHFQLQFYNFHHKVLHIFCFHFH